MSFNHLKGQHELSHALSVLLQENRLSHAILLTGPAGSGKTSWGMALARAVLCLEESSSEACLQCNSCRQFQSGNHPDFFLIAPDTRNIKIEQVRSLKRDIYLVGDNKVCLIEKAESMTAEAASSLLKILEEPPEGLHFILLAEHPRLLFDTILSRCQAYALQPLNMQEIESLLLNVTSLDRSKASFIARISGGLPGYAIKLAEDEQLDNRLSEASSLAFKFVFENQSAFEVLSRAATLSEREDLFPFLEMLCLFYRDCLIYNLCREEKLLFHPELVQQVCKKQINAQVLEEIILLINSAIYELSSTNVNRRLLLEKTLILMQRRLQQWPR